MGKRSLFSRFQTDPLPILRIGRSLQRETDPRGSWNDSRSRRVPAPAAQRRTVVVEWPSQLSAVQPYLDSILPVQRIAHVINSRDSVRQQQLAHVPAVVRVRGDQAGKNELAPRIETRRAKAK